MATLANATVPLDGASRNALVANLPRALTILVIAAAVIAPLSLILYQSFLSAPLFAIGGAVMRATGGTTSPTASPTNALAQWAQSCALTIFAGAFG